MRLLIVSQYFWPENFRINDLVADLVRRGHQVIVLTGVPNYPDGQVYPQFRDDPAGYNSYEGAEVIRVPMFPRGRGNLRLMLNYLSFAVSATAFGLWMLRGRKFDAIFVCQLSPVTSALPAIAIRFTKRIPMAMWVLDLWPDTLEALGVVRSLKVLKLVERLVSFIYGQCDKILAQSRSFIPKIRRLAPANVSIEYFPSWAETLFNNSNVEPSSKVPKANGTFTLMFAGNIGESQDFPSIVAAAEMLKGNSGIRWVIVGDGRMSEWVSSEIQKRNLQDNFLMLGRHPLEEMPSFYRHADALLLSLKDEPIFSMTIPGKLQSYLAFGAPVIAMLNGEGADLLARSGAGIACPAGNPDALAKAILRLSAMPIEERTRMGLIGQKICAEEFNRDGLLAKLENWLNDLRPKN